MTDPLLVVPALLVAGAVAGLLAGLLGIGGGLVFVPALLAILRAAGVPAGEAMHIAVGSSLAAIVLTSVASIRAHAGRRNVDGAVFRVLWPGLVAGALAGAALASVLGGDLLRQVFGGFLLLAAVQLFTGLAPDPGRRPPGRLEGVLAGGAIGTVSALLGIGGGTLTVPYLAWCRLPVLRAVGTAAAAGLPLAAAGAAGFIVAGWDTPGRPPYSTGYVAWPAVAILAAASVLTAPAGAALASRVPAATLRRVLAAVLAVVAVQLVMD